jgi:hypothetical protein
VHGNAQVEVRQSHVGYREDDIFLAFANIEKGFAPERRLRVLLWSEDGIPQLPTGVFWGQ